MRSLHRNFCKMPEGGKRCLEIREPTLKHRFKLIADSFDEGTGKILGNSRLDGLTAVAWLKSDGPICRDLRKACLLNILAKLATVPSSRAPLNQYVQRIEVVEPDRVYAKILPGFFATVRANFLEEDGTVHPSHKRLLRRFGLESRDYKLVSYRENRGKASLQIVGTVPRKASEAGNEAKFVDIDLDRANPSYDTWRAMLHWGHLLKPGKTNHLQLMRDKLNQGATKDFLYCKAVPRRQKRA